MSLDIEDPAALVEYLRSGGRIGSREDPRIQVLTGGVSNRTVLVERRPAEQGAWVIKQALPKLRVEVDWYSDPKRIHREALGLRRLTELLPEGAVPRFVFEDQEYHLLAMDAVPQPHENWKSRLLAGMVDPADVTQFARMLAAIHRGSAECRKRLEPEFADRSFFESLRLEPYYAYAATQVPEAVGFLETLIDETRRCCVTLVHGDFSPKNILIHRGRLVLLDHEVIHWGDPAFDVGFSLTHLLSKAHHLGAHRAAFAKAAISYWDHYRDAIGVGDWQDGLEHRAVRHTLGCLLARVAGRSPLEYLSGNERARQQRVVIELVDRMPQAIHELANRFIARLDSDARH